MDGSQSGYSSDPHQVNAGIPSDFLCPISRMEMTDPHIAMDGHVYDRSSIEAWFNDGKLYSPVSDERIESTLLVPNHPLRSKIMEWKAANRRSELARADREAARGELVMGVELEREKRIHTPDDQSRSKSHSSEETSY